jgi:hypothetical protein
MFLRFMVAEVWGGPVHFVSMHALAHSRKSNYGRPVLGILGTLLKY